MSTNCLLFHALIFLSFVQKVLVLNNGLALKPPMGWMSWGYYECGVDCKRNPHKCLNEQLIMSVADHFYNDGYLEAGYEYIVIDDCWSEMERDEEGNLVADRERFPRGMKFLADYIHARGLKFGMYTNVAPHTCKGYPASLHHMEADSKLFAQWDVDYLKVDGCFVSEGVLNSAYKKLGGHLNATGRPMVYSCSWPYYIKYIHKHSPNYTEISKYCNLWRDFHDIFPHWPNLVATIRHYEDQYPLLETYHGPGHWFDPDMLLIGRNSLKPGQSRIQMAVYSMLSAPLMISCDLNHIGFWEKKLLLNWGLTSLATDEKGLPAKPYKRSQDMTIWVKQHSPRKADMYPSFSFAFVNMGATEMDIAIKPIDYGLNYTYEYTVYDVFREKFVKNMTINDFLEANIPSEDVILYTLYPL